MRAEIEYFLNNACSQQISEHLLCCDAEFVPPLSNRVNINDYSEKIANHSTRFEAWAGETLVGLAAVYCNDRERYIAHITNVSVLREWQAKGIAARLIGQCVDHAGAQGMMQVRLEVGRKNMRAIRMYEKSGFAADGSSAQSIEMSLKLGN